MTTITAPPAAASEATARLHERIYAPLAALRLRCRLYQGFDGFLRLFVALIVTGLLQLGLDYWLRFSVDQRAALNVGITIIWLIVIHRYLVRPLLQPLPDRLLASWVDRAHPELREHLTTAVELAAVRTGDSPQLVAAVLREAADAAGGVSFLAVLDHRRSALRAVGFAVAALTIAFAWLIFPDMMNTWFARNWLLRDIPWKQSTYIVPIDFDPRTARRRIPRGEEVEVRASITGQAPRSAALLWNSAGGRQGRETMTLVGQQRLVVSLGPLTEDLTFRIVGGDERTRLYTIEAVDAPQLLNTRARITPPDYTQLAPIELEQQTFLEMLEGSTLEIEARANKRLARAEWVGSGGPVGQSELEGALVRLTWQQPVSGSYRLELQDDDGWRDRNPVRYIIKVVPDRPPVVQLQLIGVSDLITPEAELTLRIEVEDVYGLASAGLLARNGEQPPVTISIPGFTPPARRSQGETLWPVSEARAAAGDRLQLWAEAADLDPRGPNVTRTPPVELRVVSAEEFQAELARRELELRRDFEHLLNGQRGLDESLRRLASELAPERAPSAAQVQRLSGLSRQQAAHAVRALGIAERFGHLLTEMRTNRVARAAIERRISERILTPLFELGRAGMPSAAAALDVLRNPAPQAALDGALAEQQRVLAAMQAILANMLEWEGFREAVALLQEIIAEQGQVRAATLELLERQLERILDLDDEPALPPRP